MSSNQKPASSNQKSAWTQSLQSHTNLANQVSLSNLNPQATSGKLAVPGNQAVPEKVIEALQQISNSDSVTGFTVCVVELAGNSNDQIRMWAAESLERSIQPSDDEVPALIELLETSEEGEIRYWAATMLGRLGSAAAEAGQALSDCLEKSLHLPARERSAWALCQIGDAAIVAKDSLNKAAQDAPPRLRRLAAEALKRIAEAA